MSNNKVEATFTEGDHFVCSFKGCTKESSWVKMPNAGWRRLHLDGTSEHSWEPEPSGVRWWEFWK